MAGAGRTLTHDRPAKLSIDDGDCVVMSLLPPLARGAELPHLPGLPMTYEKLDTDELLRLALEAMNAGREADSIVMLKTLLEREPDHVHARYLLAAQHAQLGMMERAEAGFRDVIARSAELPIARFQLAQMLLLRGANQEAQTVLAPLAAAPDGQALGGYARALTAAAVDDTAGTIAGLQSGLACAQDIPALAGDMRRLLDQLLANGPIQPPPGDGAAPLFLSGYGRRV